MNGGSQLHTSAAGSALIASATGVGACPLAATIRFQSTLQHLLGDRSGRYRSVYYDRGIAEPVPGLESQTAAKATTQSINFHPHCVRLLMVSFLHLLCYLTLDAFPQPTSAPPLCFSLQTCSPAFSVYPTLSASSEIPLSSPDIPPNPSPSPTPP